MKKFSIIAIILICLSINIKADDFSDAIIKAKKKLNEASNKNDKAAILKVRGDFERILQLKKNEWLVNYYLAAVDFILSYNAIADSTVKNEDNADIKKYTESSLSLLDKSTDGNDQFAEAWIMKLAVNSNRWMYEPQKMNDIIAKLTEAKDKAEKLDPDNPRFYLIDGTNTFYTPENFGGGPDKALPMLKKSWDLFQTYKPKDETYPDWGKDQAAGMLALTYVKLEKLSDAKTWIDKALEMTPDSGFIKGYVMKEYEKAGGK